MPIYSDGATPKYEPIPPKPAPDSAYPHDTRSTSIIIESMCVCVGGRDYFESDSLVG